VFTDSADGIQQLLKKVIKEEKKLTSTLEELYKSYVRILADQKIDHYVVIGRSTWCNGDSCSEYGSSYTYSPVKVDEPTYEYFGSLNNSIATYENGFFSGEEFKLLIPKNKWDLLKLDFKKSFPSWDDYGEYWVENTYARAAHKYIDIIDSRSKHISWKNVSENEYWKHQEHLGMAILSKPYGMFTAETLKKSEPVGMSMVAAPSMQEGKPTGSNQYGEWRQDESGVSFWHFLGAYALINTLTSNQRYSYDDWLAYQKRPKNKDFYGRDEQFGTYGYHTYSSSRYNGSTYARRNAKEVQAVRNSSNAGKVSKTSPSIRTAGVSARGRGPSGGGK
jgi:hypothetical protein